MATIFLSYRHDDTAGAAGRIFDRLKDHFRHDAVFMDVEGIPLGLDFREYLHTKVGRADVVIAVIGPRWAEKAGYQRWIDSPADYVRIELDAALQRNIPVIPVLVDRARMPDEAELPLSLAPLARFQAATVDEGREFNLGVSAVIKAIEYSLKRRGVTEAQGGSPGASPLIASFRGAAGDEGGSGTDPYATVVVDAGLGPVPESDEFDEPQDTSEEIQRLFTAPVRELIEETLANPEQWLRAANPRLGGRRPIELLGTEEEAKIRDMLIAFNLGMF
jgi:hypothetical protein